MKILIMVLSYNVPPYDELMKAQINSWDTVVDPDIATVYYFGGIEDGSWSSTPLPGFPEYKRYMLRVSATDAYYYMAGKFKKALEWVKDWDYDFIFRTNSSSYVDKKNLKEFAEKLPKEKCYAGWTMVDSNDDGGLAVSGAGIFLSKDCADFLRENIDPNFEQEEDIYISRLLRRNGITAIDDKSRVDVTDDAWYVVGDTYHYRFKTDNRITDAKNMIKVHESLQR